MTMANIDIWDEELAAAARTAMGHAYAPYSDFAVGAAVRLSDGRIITGANFENASYGLSLCAETVAIAATNAAGGLRDIRAIALIGGPMAGSSEDVAPITPCGRCRQVIAEVAVLAERDIKVYCASLSGTQQAVYTIAELLPHAFSAADFSA